MNGEQGGDRPLPPNFVIYDRDNPSPFFPLEEIAYIESINGEFSQEELAKIRSFERFVLNLNTGYLGADSIPGLRKDEGQDHLYVKRFSREPWKTFIGAFMAHISDGFPDKVRCVMELDRITLPNGDRYYPITFLGNLDEWRLRLKKAADECGTLLGRFDKGKFVLSDGQVIDFGSLKLDRLARQKRIPANW